MIRHLMVNRALPAAAPAQPMQAWTDFQTLNTQAVP